ncbi:MAG: hypothetical protein CMJ46_05175 [Planctomyces sp.]|nr:hypothetical protein [Planctomyces sp.]
MTRLLKHRLTKFLLGMLIVLLCGFFTWRYWRVASIPDVGEPFDVEAYLTQTDDGEEIARITIEAGKMWSKIQDANEKKWFSFYNDYTRPRPWAEVDPEIKADVLHAEPILEDWFQVNDLQAGFFLSPLNYNNTGSVQRNLYSQLLGLGRLSKYCVLERNQRGEHHRVRGIYLGFLQAAARFRHDSGITEIRISTIVKSIFDGTLPTYLNHPDVTGEELRQLQSVWEQFLEEQPTPSHYLKYDYLQNREMLTDALDQEYPKWTTIANEKEVLRRVRNLVYTNWLTHCDDIPDERPDVKSHTFTIHHFPESFSNWGVTSTHDFEYFPDKNEQELFTAFKAPSIKKSDVAESLCFPLAKYIAANDRYRLRTQLYLTQVALHIYYREHNQFPDTLDELVPDYLTTLPRNPDITGSTVAYVLENQTATLTPVDTRLQRVVRPPGSDLPETTYSP